MADSRLGKPSKKTRPDKTDRRPVSLAEVPYVDDGSSYMEYDKVKKETINKSGVPRVHKKRDAPKLDRYDSIEEFLRQEDLIPAECAPGGLSLHVVKNEITSMGKRIFRPTLITCQIEKLSASGNRAHVVLEPGVRNIHKVVFLNSLYKKAG